MTMNAASALGDLAGHWLGPFQLIEVLGIGAMGAVYLAKDSILHRDVAIKLLAKGSADTDPERRDRFLREARAAARLIHPNVVQIFQVGEDAVVRFIAMEYVQGMTTARAAKQSGGRLMEQFGIEKMREAAAALQLGAAHGISHLDVKPANLLLNSSGTLKIADFGLASYAEVGGAAAPAQRTLEGTPFYMSPEQWSGGPAGAPSDVYSLGCTFYHLLVGRTPYPARDLAGCYRAHCKSPIPDPRVAMPDLDPLLGELLKRCMAKSPEIRPTAAQIVDLLDDMLLLRRSNVRPRVDAQSPLAPPVSGSAASGVLGFSQTAISATSSLNALKPTGFQLSTTARKGLTGQHSYRDYFGLTSYPFSDIRQPSSFWDAGPYAWILRTLASQILAGQRPAMLVGEPGSGRTFVCEMIRAKFRAIQTFSIEPQLLFGARPMVALCRQLGAPDVRPDTDQRILLDVLLQHVAERGNPDTTAVVVVDGMDAEDRDLIGELEDILRNAPPRRLSMLLIGSPDLPSALAANGASQALYAGAQSLLLPGMAPKEMSDYIDFRMQSVGGSARGLGLDLPAQQLLHARSGGRPKLVNVFCHNALTITALLHESDVRLATVRLAMKSKSYLTPETAMALLEER
jgi:serine/threonine protein kinase